MANSGISPKDALDAVLHQPIRTRIVAYLVGRGGATFTELKQVLNLSDGNLDSHLKKLLAAKYIATRKDDSAARAQTVYSLTKIGESALRQYVASLQRMLGFDAGAGARTASAPATHKGKLAWSP
jgi:DNA-binding MarR family transcriptional regulator